MSLDLARFSNINREPLNHAGAGTGQTGDARKPREEAQFWLNFGYIKNYRDENGDEAQTFVSRHGIPLDFISDFDLSRIRNANMATLRRDQNKFHGSVMDRARALAPGESVLICYDEQANLGVELRRAGEAAAPIEEDDNAAPAFSFRG